MTYGLSVLLVLIAGALAIAQQPQFPEDASTTQAPTPAPTTPAPGNGATITAPVGTAVTGTNCAARVAQLSPADQAAPAGAGAVVDLSQYAQERVPVLQGSTYYSVSLCGTVVQYTNCAAGQGAASCEQQTTLGSMQDVGAGIESGSAVSMNISFVGEGANSCGKTSGALVELSCGVAVVPPPCFCGSEVCVCPPVVHACDDPLYPGRPDFQAYIAQPCTQTSTVKSGLNIGSIDKGTDLVSSGIAARGTKEYPASAPNATIYLSLGSGDSRLKYLPPQLSGADYLGNVKLSETGASALGGTLSPTQPGSFSIDFDCGSSESVVKVNVTVPIPPYDPVSFEIAKVCAAAAVVVGAPQNVIATAVSGSFDVQLRWAGATDTVTAYRVQPVLLQAGGDQAELPPKDYPIAQSSTGVTVPNLAAGQYKFMVTALNEASSSTASSSNVVTVSTVASPNPQYPSSSGVPSQQPTQPHISVSHVDEIDDDDSSSASVMFFWFVCVWMLLCVCGCVYKHNQGEEGLDIVPGATVLYKLDDTFFEGKYTSHTRQFQPVQTEEGQVGASPRAPVTAEQHFEIPNISSKESASYQDL